MRSVLLGEAQSSNWLKCLRCGNRLAVVIDRNGHTTIEIAVFGFLAWLERAEIICPQCGTVRRFTSAPVRCDRDRGMDATYVTSG